MEGDLPTFPPRMLMPINDKRKERDTSFKRPFHFQLFNLMKKVYKAC